MRHDGLSTYSTRPRRSSASDPGRPSGHGGRRVFAPIMAAYAYENLGPRVTFRFAVFPVLGSAACFAVGRSSGSCAQHCSMSCRRSSGTARPAGSAGRKGTMSQKRAVEEERKFLSDLSAPRPQVRHAHPRPGRQRHAPCATSLRTLRVLVGHGHRHAEGQKLRAPELRMCSAAQRSHDDFFRSDPGKAAGGCMDGPSRIRAGSRRGRPRAWRSAT